MDEIIKACKAVTEAQRELEEARATAEIRGVWYSAARDQAESAQVRLNKALENLRALKYR